jgi:hypothetical protein
MEDEGIVNIDYLTYKYRGHAQIHLVNNCITIKGSPSASLLSTGKVDYLSLLENIVSYNSSFNLCDQCYWGWGNKVLDTDDITILNYLINSKEELKVNFEELNRINREPSISSEILEDLLELNLRVSSRRELLEGIVEKDSAKYIKTAERIIGQEAQLYEKVKESIANLKKEFEINEVKDFLLHNYLNKEMSLVKSPQAHELFLDCEVELYEVQEKITSSWLECLNQSQKLRDERVVNLLTTLNPYQGESEQELWNLKIKRYIKPILNHWEKAYSDVINRQDFILVANLEFYIDFEHALFLFKHLYPKVKVGKKIAFTLPGYWRDWLTIDSSHFDRSRASEYLNTRMSFLEPDLTNEELRTLLTLWEPEAESIYSNANQVAKAVRRLS